MCEHMQIFKKEKKKKIGAKETNGRRKKCKRSDGLVRLMQKGRKQAERFYVPPFGKHNPKIRKKLINELFPLNFCSNVQKDKTRQKFIEQIIADKRNLEFVRTRIDCIDSYSNFQRAAIGLLARYWVIDKAIKGALSGC